MATGNSGVICDKYASEHNIIKAFHLENGGVSNARNVGIDIAIGKYLMFVDSDDYIDITMVDKCMDNMRGVDLCAVGAQNQYFSGDDIVKTSDLVSNETGKLLDVEFLKKLHVEVPGNHLYWATCKMFKLDVIKLQNIKFNQKISYCEDTLFVIEYLKYCKSIYVVKEPLYFYRHAQGVVTLSHNKHIFEYFNFSLLTLNTYIEMLKSKDVIINDGQQEIYSRLKSLMVLLYEDVNMGIEKKELKKRLQKLKEVKKIME